MRSLIFLTFTLLGASAAAAQNQLYSPYPAPLDPPALRSAGPARELGWQRESQRTTERISAPALPESKSKYPVDAADSLYRLGRSALTDGDFKRAAEVFQMVADKYPDSEFAPDALYYRAYALYKIGTFRELQLAVVSLDRQATRYPKAGTMRDAKELRASIRSEQAKRGDGVAGQEIAMGAKTLGAENRCPTEDDDMRLTALNSLLQQDPDQVIPVLQKLLARADDCSIRLRKRAVNMLAQTKEEERSDILLRVASSDPSNEVRREAVQWLSEVNTERAAKALDSILFSARDAEIRDRALSALSRHRNPAARASLRRFAEQTSVSTDLRARAISYLGSNRRVAEDNDFLMNLFGKTASPELKLSIIEALSAQTTGAFGFGGSVGFGQNASAATIAGLDRAAQATASGGGRSGTNVELTSEQAARVQWLVGIARDKNQEIEVRKKALHYASLRGAPLKDMIAMYGEMNDQPQMQDQLLYVYNQRREPEAIDQLINVAKTEKNAELRKKAVFWLGTKKDPRVKQFLLDLIVQ